jgi:hypothetical protein
MRTGSILRVAASADFSETRAEFGTVRIIANLELDKEILADADEEADAAETGNG